MIAYIVCEGYSDAKILQSILPKELLKDVEIVSAGGLSAAKSLSRSLLVRRQLPVAIVVDADSTDPDLVRERYTSIEEIVEGVAVDTPVKVILAVPAMAAIFFQDRLLLSRLLGYEPSQETLSLALSQPYKALQHLLPQSENDNNQLQILDKLTDRDLEILRKAPVIQEIIHFLESVHRTVQSAAS